MSIAPVGIHSMPADSYHALDTPTPALSASIARVLLGQSPLHAAYAHSTLTPDGQREEKDVWDIGTAAHALILEGVVNAEIIDAKDYKTKAAQEARDAARAAGKTPILAHRWKDVRFMAEAIQRQLLAHPMPAPLTMGKPEQTLVWEEDGLWCKARLDWLHDDYRFVDDLKSGEDANPDRWTRGQLFNLGFDCQAAWYLRGLKILTGVEAEFRFILAETRPPYAVSVIGLGPDVLMLAEKKCRRALELWRECIRSGRFPGYPAYTVHADLPPWAEASWIAREYRDEDMAKRARGVADDGRSIEDLLAEGTR